jgi:ribosomal protein S18 acetylase RimI-like enzyme
LTYRAAGPEDAEAVLALVRRAYRGETSRAGWTTEAHLLDDERIDLAGVQRKIADPDGFVLLAHDSETTLVACCELASRGNGLGYFGMFAVEPTRQAGGIGRAVLANAERRARRRWQLTALELTVIAQRRELIAWYERRGYHRTGEKRPFPFHALVNGRALRSDLHFVVLRKPFGPEPVAQVPRTG